MYKAVTGDRSITNENVQINSEIYTLSIVSNECIYKYIKIIFNISEHTFFTVYVHSILSSY